MSAPRAAREREGPRGWLTSRLAQENLIAVALLVIFGGVIWLSLDFGPRARMIPLPLAVFGIVLTLIQLVWQNVRSTDELQMDLIAVSKQMPAAEAGAATEQAPAASRKDAGPSWRREARAFAVVALLIALIFTLGLMPSVFLFTAGYFVVSRHYSWRAGLVYTAVFTAGVYVVFMVVLQIQPYHGLLEPIVERLR